MSCWLLSPLYALTPKQPSRVVFCVLSVRGTLITEVNVLPDMLHSLTITCLTLCLCNTDSLHLVYRTSCACCSLILRSRFVIGYDCIPFRFFALPTSMSFTLRVLTPLQLVDYPVHTHCAPAFKSKDLGSQRGTLLTAVHVLSGVLHSLTITCLTL